MTTEIQSRQLGPGHDEALDNLRNAAERWAIPFLRLWMHGSQPRAEGVALVDVAFFERAATF